MSLDKQIDVKIYIDINIDGYKIYRSLYIYVERYKYV